MLPVARFPACGSVSPRSAASKNALEMERRRLPSVDQFVNELGEWPLPRNQLVAVARRVIDAARQLDQPGDLAASARAELEGLVAGRLQAVINATGVLLHTNLGRAPLAPEAAEAAARVAQSFTNLEFDLAQPGRGKRGSYLQDLLTSATGAEAALVANNNAAGLVLALAALAAEREVVVSRGELIEIGGAYRLPEIVGAGGARLREVGTTNRTRVEDYRAALGSTTGAVLKVHTSNFRIEGFTAEATLPDLVALSEHANVPVVFDAGSGLLDANVPWLAGPPPVWLGLEPGIKQSVAQAPDLVLFSGDKLLGGPQAGIVVGRASTVEKLLRHPLARALRLDGPTVAALTATLEMYADGRGAEIPIWQMAAAPYAALEERLAQVIAASGVAAEIEAGESVVGAGSVPGSAIPSPVAVIRERVDELFTLLLAPPRPILTRRQAGSLLIDLRSVLPGEDGGVAAGLRSAWRS